MRRPVMVLHATFALLVLLVALPASAAVHDVQQQGFVFNPSEITIDKGDTVRWHWNDGIHTVTNGVNPNSPDAGALFDAPLDNGNATFEYTFTITGTIPYHCRFHFGLGMTGTVTVNNDVPVKASTWGRIKALYGGEAD
jgi:plastocyanin